MEQTASSPEHDIIATDIVKRFGDQTVIDGASFSVRRGQIFGFIGPSGSGKTTTIRLLTGVYSASSGQISVLGQNPAKFSRTAREQIGYLPQQFVLYPNLSVLENMRFTASLYGIRPWRRGKLIQKALEFVEMWEHRGKLASNISGGMQRRLELAAALVHDPQLIFADEPTAGIDPVLRERFWQGFKELREQGRTLFVTTQYVTEAEYCDYVALMAQGRVVASGTPESLRRTAVGGDAVDIKTSGLSVAGISALEKLPGVRRIDVRGMGDIRAFVDDSSRLTPKLLDVIQEDGATIETVEEYHPTFDEVFVMLLERNDIAASVTEAPVAG